MLPVYSVTYLPGCPHRFASAPGSWPDWLPLQLLLQLVKEAPVRALRNDLLRGGLDHPRLVETEGIEPHGVLGVVLAPPAVRNLLHRLERVLVLVAAVGDQSSRFRRFQRAKVRRLQDRAQRPFRRDGMLANECLVRADDAAEVLRPWAIRAAADDDVADILRPKLLRHRGESHQRVDFLVLQELRRLLRWLNHEVDVPGRVEADMRRHAGGE